MRTGSSWTVVGWKSGHTTFVPLWDREWRELGYGLSREKRKVVVFSELADVEGWSQFQMQLSYGFAQQIYFFVTKHKVLEKFGFVKSKP